MRTLLLPLAVAILASNVWAGVTASVFLADEETPLALREPNVPDVYRDIMVGTRLTILIESDQPGYWWGSLLIPWDQTDKGLVWGRGPSLDGTLLNFWGSCLEAAGEDAGAWLARNPDGVGVEFDSDKLTVPGEWFVFDYWAEAGGTCDVDFYVYDFEDITTFLSPARILSFTHVPSRDFDGDTIVNFRDFAPLASQWKLAVTPDPNAASSPDLNSDGLVDTFDVALFSQFWLECTDSNEPDTEPNAPASDR